ncbi:MULTISPECIES: hypothetical protein [unclassified Arthrobacter]|uniref:hypothetical protein n=1 Tax=unclassified Arthrobacter TaxID=235627 RepID=UPI001490F9ED|nr:MULTISPECIES: hypothetical protein [unclassified Arthrobacter]MBE0010146.1 hypothetical protein [Arthrobacter sp. AET 35A]NOJ64070.1 hypothetical protein [Arthrobacter sp. 147(2020)]
MSVPTEQTHLLDPDPSVVADLIEKVVGQPWPEHKDQFNAYFKRIGCTPGQALKHEEDLPESMSGVLFMPVAGMESGSWCALDGKLFSLNFMFYPGMLEERAASDVGGRLVYERLNSAYGVTDRIPQGDGNWSAAWTVRETSIDLHAHVNQAPMMQLGLSHSALTAIHDKQYIDRRGY